MTDLLITLAWLIGAGILGLALVGLFDLVLPESRAVINWPAFRAGFLYALASPISGMRYLFNSRKPKRSEDCINGFMGDSLRTRRDRDKEGGWANARRTPAHKPNRDTLTSEGLDSEGRG